MNPPAYSFERKHRLSRKTEIERVIREGASVRDDLFIVLFSRNQISNSRIAVSVKRKLGNAVLRNRIRRYVKEVFRQSKDSYPKGYDILFIARKELADSMKRGQVSFKEIWDSLNSLGKTVGDRRDEKSSTGNH